MYLWFALSKNLRWDGTELVCWFEKFEYKLRVSPEMNGARPLRFVDKTFQNLTADRQDTTSIVLKKSQNWSIVR